MKREVTLDEVARQSGVSRATASRALNNRDGVRDDVRQRVRMIADALGYRPNRAAQNLAGSPASVIGLVVREWDLMAQPYKAALVQAVAEAADSFDQALVLIMGANDPNETVRETVRAGFVDGLILTTTTTTSSDWVEQVLETAVPAVIIGSPEGEASMPLVDVESLKSSMAMVGHLFDTGCGRVATIAGPPNRDDGKQRLEGYRLAHAQRSIPVDESLIFQGDFTRAIGYELAPVILGRGVDGLFCANDDMARGVYRWALDQGIKIPDELSLAGFDGTGNSPFDSLQLTSVVQPYRKMADVAVDLLLRRIADDRVSGSRLIEPSIFYGATTRPPALVSEPALPIE